MSNPTNWFSNLINNSRAAAASRNTNNNSDGSGPSNAGGTYPGQRQTQGPVSEAMGINEAMERIFLAQQAAALERYNRSTVDPNLRSQVELETQQRQQSRATGVPPPSAAATPGGGGGGLMSMLGNMMENMAERVVPVEIGVEQQETGPPPASEKVLRTIPEIVVGEEDLEDEANRECCVCLEENAIGSTVKRLPCGHLFHPTCIDSWITHHCTCPVCRYELDTDDPTYNRGRILRMKGRRPRYRIYELERMGGKDIVGLARELGVDVKGCVDKGDIVDRIVGSGKIDVIKGGGKGRAYTMEEIDGMKVKVLKGLLRERGVKWREEDVVERGDLVKVLVNSGRVEIMGGGEEEDIMGIDDSDEEEEGKREGEGKEEEEGKVGEGWVDVAGEEVGGEEEKDGEEEEKDGEEEEKDGEEEEKKMGTAKKNWEEEEEKERGSKRYREDSGVEDDLGSSGIKREELAAMSVGELKRICREEGIDVRGVVEKKELVQRVVDSGVVLIADF
ncbi:hypothetical protein TrCOL_g1725 [Triparma columacea]|uniref:RING-type E3 ubiquitin transferase n=1 Tax=Triparma columacea TaxID=722753 RepID=A0A9W7GAV7_9STRA|nr:hypothetical protein TrCOL_g1725 [Triparma columacea]